MAKQMVGCALLWAGLAALVWVPTSGGGNVPIAVAALGFLAFSAGLFAFADGVKRQIVQELRGR